MSRPRTLVLTAALMTSCIANASAQLVVTDRATAARNSVTAGLKESILEVLAEQYSKLRRMAMRLSLHSDLRKYAAKEPPLWRTHDFESYVFANGYTAALNYGDAMGTEYERWQPSTWLTRQLSSLRIKRPRFASTGVVRFAPSTFWKPTPSTRRWNRVPRQSWTRSAARC